MRLTLVFLMLNFVLSAQNAIQNAINNFAAYSDVKYASISFCAIDIEKNEILATHNPNLSLITASTMKAITTSTALAVFGKDYRFETVIEYEGSLEDGVLLGNLYLKGYGDPSLASPFMEDIPKLYTISQEFVNAIKKAGIKTIKGNIIGDGSYFDYETMVPSWQWMDMGNHYGAGVMGINLYDNLYYLNFQQVPYWGAQPKISSVIPAQNNLKIINEVTSANRNSGDNSIIYASPYATEATVRGTIPAGTGIFSIMGAVTDPEFFAADWLYQSLKNNGISISGKPISQRIFKSTVPRTKIHTHYSPTLSELIKHTNEVSRNMYCEAYVKAIGKKLKNVGSLDAGIAAISEFWRTRGIETNGLFMEDGSGLSARNSVSAKIMTDIMRKIYVDNNSFPNFKKLLAIAGRTGTFKYFGKGTILDGNFHGKGGSMSRVRSITGYITTKSKRNVAFTIIVNNFNCSGAVLKQRMEQLMLAIAAMNN